MEKAGDLKSRCVRWERKRSVSGRGVCEYDRAEIFSQARGLSTSFPLLSTLLRHFHVRESYTSLRFLLPPCLLFSFGTEASICRAGFPHCNLVLLFALKWAASIDPEKSKFC